MSDDSNGCVEVQDFLDWCYSDEEQVTGGGEKDHVSLESLELPGLSKESTFAEQTTRSKTRKKKRKKRKKRALQRKQRIPIAALLTPMRHATNQRPWRDKLSSRVLRAFEEVMASVGLSLSEVGATVKDTFDTFDMNGDGLVDMPEFEELLDVLEIGSGGDDADVLRREDKKCLFDLFDGDGDGVVSLSDFERMVSVGYED